MCDNCDKLQAERDQLLRELRQANDLLEWYSSRLRQALTRRPRMAATVPDGLVWWRGKGGSDGR